MKTRNVDRRNGHCRPASHHASAKLRLRCPDTQGPAVGSPIHRNGHAARSASMGWPNAALGMGPYASASVVINVTRSVLTALGAIASGRIGTWCSFEPRDTNELRSSFHSRAGARPKRSRGGKWTSDADSARICHRIVCPHAPSGARDCFPIRGCRLTLGAQHRRPGSDRQHAHLTPPSLRQTLAAHGASRRCEACAAVRAPRKGRGRVAPAGRRGRRLYAQAQ